MSDTGSGHGHNSVVILLDECGDLGRSPNSSRYFIVAAMVIHDPNALVRLIKNARKKLGKKDWKGEIKFNNTTNPIRALILEGVAKLDCQVVWVSFEKDKLSSALLKNEKLLYLEACEIVLREIVRRIPAKRMHVMIDKRYTNKKERDKIDMHIRTLVENNHAGYFIPQVQVSQYDSIMSKELQIHDFIVGAIYQRIERGVYEYIDLIESKIVFHQER